MEYNNNTPVEYGDIICISTKDNKYVTVEEDGETITLKDFENNGHKQKILVCGKQDLGDKFYLTFKYSRGFLYYENILKSGVPWTERTLFTVNLLKQAIGVDDLVILKMNEE